LTKISGGNQETDIAGRKVPHANQDGQHKRQSKCIEGIKEGSAAHDDAGLGVPAGERDVFDPKQKLRGAQFNVKYIGVHVVSKCAGLFFLLKFWPWSL
jgi:hypothetical protein